MKAILWWMALIAFVLLAPVILPSIWGVKLLVRLGISLLYVVITN